MLHRVADVSASNKLAASLIEAACVQHKTPPHDVAILTLKALEEGSLWRVDRLGGQRIADKPQVNHVTATTVRRFKGLEAVLAPNGFSASNT